MYDGYFFDQFNLYSVKVGSKHPRPKVRVKTVTESHTMLGIKGVVV